MGTSTILTRSISLYNYIKDIGRTVYGIEEGDIMIDYTPFWTTMKCKKISQYRLLKETIIDNKTLDSIKKGGNITLNTVEKLCIYLECTPNGIVRFTFDDTKEQNNYELDRKEDKTHMFCNCQKGLKMQKERTK